MTATRGLTPRQAQVLDAIDDLTRAHGHPPTVREIAEEVGLSSPSSVQAHIAALVARGQVRRRGGRMRTLQVA